MFVFFDLLDFILSLFTLLYFTLPYLTLLYFRLPYFTKRITIMVGIRAGGFEPRHSPQEHCLQLMRTESTPYYNVAYTTWYHGGGTPTQSKGGDSKKPTKKPKIAPPNTDDPQSEEPDPAKATAKASAGPGSLAALLNGITD